MILIYWPEFSTVLVCFQSSVYSLRAALVSSNYGDLTLFPIPLHDRTTWEYCLVYCLKYSIALRCFTVCSHFVSCPTSVSLMSLCTIERYEVRSFRNAWHFGYLHELCARYRIDVSCVWSDWRCTSLVIVFSCLFCPLIDHFNDTHESNWPMCISHRTKSSQVNLYAGLVVVHWLALADVSHSIGIGPTLCIVAPRAPTITVLAITEQLLCTEPGKLSSLLSIATEPCVFVPLMIDLLRFIRARLSSHLAISLCYGNAQFVIWKFRLFHSELDHLLAFTNGGTTHNLIDLSVIL